MSLRGIVTPARLALFPETAIGIWRVGDVGVMEILKEKQREEWNTLGLIFGHGQS
jgi:hypothetical protein